MTLFKTVAWAIFSFILTIPATGNTQTSMQISLDNFTHGLEVDDTVVNYNTTKTQLRHVTTPFGPADQTLWTGTADDFIHTINLLQLSEYDGAYIATHSIEFTSDTGIDGLTGFSFNFPRRQDTRIAYGPADNTSYQIEDTINIPAVTGYSKEGNMLFGGTPFNDVWTRGGGLFVSVLATEPDTFELPITVTATTVNLAHYYYPDGDIGAKTDFKAGETLTLPPIMVGFHQGDFFTPLRNYTRALETYSGKPYIDVPLGTPTASHPYWKTWGLDKSLNGDFTAAQVLEISDTLAARGIRRIMLDYGWFITEGIWDAEEDRGFSGNNDLVALVQELKNRGFETGLWYQPLQIDPDDEDVQDTLLQYAIRDEDGDLFIDDDDLALLDPSNPAVLALVREQLEMFQNYGVKHVYLDSQMAQLAAPPNFALQDPLSSHRALPRLYELIRTEAQNRNLTIEICPDGRSQTLLNMPQAVTNIGDPKNDRQLRAKHRWLTAILGSKAIIGTYVEPFPDNGTSGSFMNIVGIGGNLQSIGDTQNLQSPKWDIWMHFYKDHNLVKADYLPLYDIAFDTPETHVLRHGPRMYYTFFTRTEGQSVCLQDDCIDAPVQMVEQAETGNTSHTVELRGLEPNALYQVTTFPAKDINIQLRANSNGVASLGINFTKEMMLIAKRLN